MRFAGLLSIVLVSHAAFAQDARRVVSPDGQIEFHLFVNGQPDTSLSRVAYQVRVRGKVLIDTSYLGFDLYQQEPLLGENVGLISEKRGENSLLARYMQNGSLARRLDVEVRVFNEGVAFRCTIGKSTGVERLQITDEATEFDLAADPNAPLTVPFVTSHNVAGWVAIAEVPLPGFPRLTLAHEDGSKILLTRLTRSGAYPDVVFDGAPPLTGPWRVVLIGADRERLLASLKALPGTLGP